jgi:UDP-N-acetyl-D-mannosaminuronic acid transferase (WecB/TagA/CpsF family)
VAIELTPRRFTAAEGQVHALAAAGPGLDVVTRCYGFVNEGVHVSGARQVTGWIVTVGVVVPVQREIIDQLVREL